MKYEERAAFEQADAFGIGAPNDAYAQYFVGDSFCIRWPIRKNVRFYGKCHIWAGMPE